MTSSERAEHAGTLALRGHHLLCLFGFRGLGYDERFVENMHGVVDRFFGAEGVRVELVGGADDVCAACPHLGEAGCAAADGGEQTVVARDRAVLGRLGLSAGDARPSPALAERVLDRISGEDLPALCAGCRWLDHGYCAEGLRLHRQAP